MTENQQIVEELTSNKELSDKQINFRAIEAKHKRELELERNARLELERKIQDLQSRSPEEEEDEPYVAPKKLDRKLAQFGQNTQSEIHKAMEIAKNQAKEELKQEMWLEKNSDFFEVMKHADKLYLDDKELAETILTMPDNFERQKLVYKTIKKSSLHQERKEPSIQDKIDLNKKSPYYQPTGIGTAPYLAVGDFSSVGQKNAYNKMQELKKRMGVS